MSESDWEWWFSLPAEKRSQLIANLRIEEASNVASQPKPQPPSPYREWYGRQRKVPTPGSDEWFENKWEAPCAQDGWNAALDAALAVLYEAPTSPETYAAVKRGILALKEKS